MNRGPGHQTQPRPTRAAVGLAEKVRDPFPHTLMLKVNAFESSIRPELTSNEYLLFLLICIPAVVGFAIQHAKEADKLRKKRAVTEKPRM